MKCELEIEPTEEKQKQMDEVLKYFLMKEKPLKFNPYDNDNILMAQERQFEELCCTMEENGVAQPKKLSEYEFYSRLKYFEKKYKDHGNK